MAIAIISDIHSNIEALDAVLSDIESVSNKYDIHEIHCLGDIIGYGPKPIKCVDRIREVCSNVVMGSHEDAICFIPEKVFYSSGYNTEYAIPSFIWTREMIKWHKPELFDYLAKLPYNSLPEIEGQKEIAEVHGTLCTDVNDLDIELQIEKHPNHQPHGAMECSSMNFYSTFEEYVPDPKDAGKDEEAPKTTFKTDCLSRTFNSLFALDRKICFLGHLHVPEAYFCEDADNPEFDSVALDFGMDIYKQHSLELNVEKNKKYVFNVGSVGQPRDKDKRACYGIYTGDKMIFRRVPYNIEVTALQLLCQPSISLETRASLIKRLSKGE